MKHLKPYKKKEIKVGDYAIIKCNKDLNSNLYSIEYDNFLKNNVATITGVYKMEGSSLVDGYIVAIFKTTKFEFSQSFSMSDIKAFSSNKEELEQMLAAEKYNI